MVCDTSWLNVAPTLKPSDRSVLLGRLEVAVTVPLAAVFSVQEMFFGSPVAFSHPTAGAPVSRFSTQLLVSCQNAHAVCHSRVHCISASWVSTAEGAVSFSVVRH